MSAGGAAVGLRPETSVLLDCRWLGHGGAGRVTEHLLRELRNEPPPGRWILWGDPERIEPLAFPASSIARTDVDPHALFGQRAALALPRADVSVYPHQIRPLRGGRSVTFVLDTIPLRHGGAAPLRLAKRAYFALVARRSSRILTISAHSRATIARDLGVRPERIDVVQPGVDLERAGRVAALRRDLPQEATVLYVGRFDRHKNLGRLCDAFARSEFGHRGRLLLVGGRGSETARLRAWIDARGLERVEVRPAVSEEELDRLLATSRALVLPSLEEGYGLPAFEAAAAGIPVAVSRTGALMELPPEAAAHFDPTDVEAMAAAIDDVVERPSTAGHVRPGGTLRADVLSAIDQALGESAEGRR